ncbi:MFS-type transporter SLC18B1 [Trichoplax sp. H2]|nr:MFS-type transporter SLC18B1 [Trichoplax sp. H2]|eukprot:RDD42094.1 MFS-type transporter SLC18B1 [Trichoplax sp. H2]
MAENKASSDSDTANLIELKQDDKSNHEPVKKEGITANQRSTSLVIFLYNAAVVSIIFSLLFPFFSPVALKKKVSNLQIGFIYAIYPMTKVVFSPLVGMSMHKIGLKYTIWIGLFLEGGCTILYGFLTLINGTTSFLCACLVVRGLQGVGAGTYQTAVFAFVATTFKESLATVVGVIEVASVLGLMAGPSLGGIFFNLGGFKLPFIVSGSLLLASSFISFCAIPSIPYEGSASIKKLMLYVLCLPRVMIIGLGLIIQIASIAFLEPSLSIRLQSLSLKTGNIGLIFLLLIGSYGLCAPIIGCIADKTGHRLIIIVGSIALGVSLQFLGPAPYINIKMTVLSSIIAIASIGISVALATVPALPDILRGTTARLVNVQIGYCKEADSVVAYAMASGIFSSFYCIGQIVGHTLGGAFGLSSSHDFRWCSSALGMLAIIQGFVVILLTIFEAWSNRKSPQPL